VLSPGFIDAHSHADDAILELRDAEAAVNQGITTVVVGQDGESKRPLADFFARLEAAPAASTWPRSPATARCAPR
jgi:N-acyl-D-amino-acid deacylase